MRALLVAALCLILSVALAPSVSAVMLFDYYQLTGEMLLYTNGDQFVALLIEGPAALSIDRWQDGTTQDGANWLQQYFNNKEQWISSNLVSPPDGVYQIATYSAGLSRWMRAAVRSSSSRPGPRPVKEIIPWLAAVNFFIVSLPFASGLSALIKIAKSRFASLTLRSWAVLALG